MVRRFAFAVVIVVIGAVSRQAEADPPPTLDDAIKSAAAAHKPLLLEVYTTWCGPCKAFEKDTLPVPRVQAALKDVMFVRYDAEDGPGIDVAARLGVTGYPTFLVLDKLGVERVRRSGAPGIARFVEIIGEARTAAEDEADVRARLKASPRDPTVQLGAARWYADHQRLTDALGHYDAVGNNPNATFAVRAEAAGSAASLRRMDLWRRQLIAEKVERARRDPASVSVEDLIIATVGSDIAVATLKTLWASVFRAQTDSEALNASIYVALAAGAKDEALVGANKMIESRRDAQHLDTLAEVHHVRGERDLALQIEDEAIAAAKSTSLEPLLVRNRARFASGTGDSDHLVQLRLRSADLWKRLANVGRLSDHVDDPAEIAAQVADRRRAQAQVKQYYAALRDLGPAVAKACAKDAGKADGAYARLVVDTTGHVTSSVVMLEDGATKALRVCLTRELAAATLPTTEPDRKIQLWIPFKSKP